jgi:citrate synthase
LNGHGGRPCPRARCYAPWVTDTEYCTTLFGWSRIAGIGAQIVDERLHFRNGRGVAIYRPKCLALHQARRAVT